MLRSSVADQSDTVILTGTGSGKTEAIYLPVLAAIVREFGSLARDPFRSAE